MTQKQKDDTTQDLAAMSRPTPPPSGGATPEEAGMTWLWRISGGILLLVAALIGVAVYQNMDRQVNLLRAQLGELNQELHRDLGRLTESQGAMIKKDEHSTRLRTVWDSIKGMNGDHTDLTRVKERCAILQELSRGNEDERRQMAEEIRRLREAQAGDNDKADLIRELRELRERLAQIEGKRNTQPVSHQSEIMPVLRPVGTVTNTPLGGR